MLVSSTEGRDKEDKDVGWLLNDLCTGVLIAQHNKKITPSLPAALFRGRITGHHNVLSGKSKK